MDNKPGKLSYEELKELCDYDTKTNAFISKKGADYINSLSLKFDLNNRNDKPFTLEQIINQPTLNDFEFAGVKEFQFICYLKAIPMRLENGKRTNEKIKTFNFESNDAENVFNNSMGIVYIFTAAIDNKEYIVKIGQSRTTFKSRLGSYNCGCVNNWRTASTTNIKILQSFLNTRINYKLYILDTSLDVDSYEWHGIKSVPFASSKALAYEDILIKAFVQQFHKKPLANIQANATQV